MKNCNEMVNSLLERREQYLKQKNSERKILLGTAIPVLTVCVALLGFSIWQGNTGIISQPYSSETGSQNESSVIQQSNPSSVDSGYLDFVGMVKVNDVSYVQCSNVTEVYTPDICLGKAVDFEGSYQFNAPDFEGELYTTKENDDVLMIKLENGDYVILICEKICR